MIDRREKHQTIIYQLTQGQGERAKGYELAGNRMGTAESKVLLGQVLLAQVDLDRAEARFQEASAIFEETGSEVPFAEILTELGKIALSRGKLDEAGATLDRALEIQERHASSVAGVTRVAMARLQYLLTY